VTPHVDPPTSSSITIELGRR